MSLKSSERLLRRDFERPTVKKTPDIKKRLEAYAKCAKTG